MKRSLTVLSLLACAVPMFAAVTGTVMTSDGQPVAGARVSIYAIESYEARRARLLSASPEAVPLASTQTDAKGNFTLESPKSALADLRVTARGHEPWQNRIERDEDAGAIALQKAETKSGTITANGKPVPDALVVLWYGSNEYLVKTDANGRYEAPDPKKARGLTVIHPDYAVSEDQAVSFSRGITSLHRTLVSGAPLTGRVMNEDGKTPVAKAMVFLDGWPLATSGDDGAFTIARAPAKWSTITAQAGSLIGSRPKTADQPLTIRAAKAATLTGRVLDTKTKLPIAGAVVRISPRAGMMMRISASDSWWGGISDAKGNYSFIAPPGAYSVFTTHPAYEMRPIDVTVASGQTSSKEIGLSPLARVSGVVTNDERKPVAAAILSAQDVREGMDFMPTRFLATTSAASGPDGRFSMRVRADSELKLRAVKKGLPPATSDAFRLGPGERKSNVSISIASGIEVTGKVTDRDGNALSGVAVSARQTPTGNRMIMQRVVIGGPPATDDDVRTASDGTFTMRLTAGTYDFTFRREGLSTRNVRAKSVSLEGPNVVETSLEPSVEITGRVTRGGAAAEGVNLFSFGDGEPIEATTGPDGSFTLTGLSPGPVRVMLRKEDELVNEQRALTAPARDVSIELPVGVRVSGRVVEKSTRKPVTSFQAGVSISRSGGGMIMMAPPQLRSFTSDDGSFTLENVPVGAVNFIATAPGYSDGRLNLNVEQGKPITNLEIELDTGVRLVGKVTGPDGAPLSDATVSIGRMPGSSSVMRGQEKRTVTSSGGEYELDTLEAGEETIEVSHPKYLTETKTIQLKGGEMRLDVQLSAGTRISGTVVTESGAGVPEADVQAFAAGGMPRNAKTDANGRFEFDSLSPMRYRFTASKNGYADGILKDVDVAGAAPLRIVLKSGGTIYGAVRGLSEEELAQTTVDARGSEGGATAAVESNGTFRIDGAPIGTVTVRATMSGRGFSSRKTSGVQTVEITPGASRQVDLEFRTDTVIKGQLRRNGQPIGGAQVTFAPRPGGAQTNASATADEQGFYTVSGLDEGEYSVIVSDMQRFTSYTTTYDVRGSATFDIDHAANTVRGRVVDAATGDPVDGARVQLRNNSPNVAQMRFADRAVPTDSAGTFVLDLVPPGTYVVTADRDGYGNDVRNLTVTDRAAEDVELRLPPNEGISLKVVDARDGRALAASFVVFDAQGRVVREQRGFLPGDATADIRIPVAAGTYTATISAMGYGTRHVTLRSPSTQSVPMSPAGRIVVRSKHSTRQRARLVDANGIAYPRWTLQPAQLFLNPSPGATTIDNVGDGLYTLQLLDDNGVIVDTKPVAMEAGQTVEIEI